MSGIIINTSSIASKSPSLDARRELLGNALTLDLSAVRIGKVVASLDRSPVAKINISPASSTDSSTESEPESEYNSSENSPATPSPPAILTEMEIRRELLNTRQNNSVTGMSIVPGTGIVTFEDPLKRISELSEFRANSIQRQECMLQDSTRLNEVLKEEVDAVKEEYAIRNEKIKALKKDVESNGRSIRVHLFVIALMCVFMATMIILRIKGIIK